MHQTQKKGTKGRLFVISGPSGSGKSTLSREAVRRTGASLSLSATTRPPGQTEVDGEDYMFISKEEFIEKINQNEFLEYAEVFGHYYGTPAPQVRQKLQSAQTVVLEIDVQGARQVFSHYPKAIGILVLPPSPQELERRLSLRGRDDTETMQKRLQKAQWEIDQAKVDEHFKYTIVNDDLEQALEELGAIIGSQDEAMKP